MRALALLALLVLPFARPETSTKVADPPKPGPLFIVGGGNIPDTLRREVIELAGGKKARALIFGQASKDPNAGREIAAAFEANGAGKVDVADLGSRKKLEEQLSKATLIWFGGGSQRTLMDELEKGRWIEPIRARWKEGAVIGGTSAGAAVMSARMIDGDDYDLTKIENGKTSLATGLRFFDNAIVDQHFVKRNRFTRLLTAVLDHPELLGVGIDESTAAVVTGTTLRVRGQSHVLVIDARRATVAPNSSESLPAAEGLALHVLKPGMEIDLSSK